MLEISAIKDEMTLRSVLDMCYRILGEHTRNIENYRYEDWKARINGYSEILLYAHDDNKIISAVLGRKENDDSIIIGFTACEEDYRKIGITKCIMKLFEINAKNLGFKYITLGSDQEAELFYEKCGYHMINELHGQKIYQKLL
ncbi:MAG TPA: GNAT family N-acetyltransferase [Clostridia bacterium]|nr:GNAT family N-acetyltransferase [Clostridia bacterium]HQO69748.1 GNAT family N-acetyltransferase [Clostridia bacterium]